MNKKRARFVEPHFIGKLQSVHADLLFLSTFTNCNKSKPCKIPERFLSLSRPPSLDPCAPYPKLCVWRPNVAASSDRQAKEQGLFRMESATLSALPSQMLPLSCSGLKKSTFAFQLKLSAPKGSRLRKRCPSITAQFELKPPSYPLDALEPHMSRNTFEFHWGKHHRAYVDNLNKQIQGTELDGKSLEEIIVITYNKGDPLPPFNNAAQVWNHDFFWACMKPGGGGMPSGTLLELIERDFGSYDAFLKEIKAAATTQFGSGWAWLTYNGDKLEVPKLGIAKTPNAVNPLVWDNITPLLTIDVWEHAYYLDYQNRRPDYVSIFMENLVSWEAVSTRLEAAKLKVAA